MGLHINYVHMLHQSLETAARGGLVCALGVQNVPFSREQLGRVLGHDCGGGIANQDDVFQSLGYVRVEALDISVDEGVEHCFDLNGSDLPAELHGRFSLVWNGGTLEHVFNIPNALANISVLLDKSGIVAHCLPVHGWVEHGFYQFSPTLMFDYYAAAGYTILASCLCRFQIGSPARWNIEPVYPGFLPAGGASGFNDDLCIHFLVAKRGEAVSAPNPLQGLYASQPAYSRLALLRSIWRMPYVLDNGVRLDRPGLAEIELDGRIGSCEGYCWCARLPEWADRSDDGQHPTRSSLMLLEDGEPVGLPHVQHAVLRTQGGGGVSHWGEYVYFSTPDNTDPRINGRHYLAVSAG